MTNYHNGDTMGETVDDHVTLTLTLRLGLGLGLGLRGHLPFH